MQIPNRVTHNQSTFPDTLESSMRSISSCSSSAWTNGSAWINACQVPRNGNAHFVRVIQMGERERVCVCVRAVADNDNAILLLASHLDIEFIYFIIFVNDAFILCGFAFASNVDDDGERHFFFRSCCCCS